MRCVFDTNVLISALLSSASTPSLALRRARREFPLLISSQVLEELDDVLRRDRFRRYVKEETIRDFVLGLSTEGEWVDLDVEIRACRDPKDDKFLSLAVSGRATHIISGDSDLLVLDPFRGIRILDPDAFLREVG